MTQGEGGKGREEKVEEEGREDARGGRDRLKSRKIGGGGMDKGECERREDRLRRRSR